MSAKPASAWHSSGYRLTADRNAENRLSSVITRAATTCRECGPSVCRRMCRNLFLLHPHFSTLRSFVVVQRSANDLKLWALVHRSFHISVAHGLHYSSQIPTLHKNPECRNHAAHSTRPSLSEGQPRCEPGEISDLPTVCGRTLTRRWKHPAFLSCAAAFAQNIEDSSTHRYEPSSCRCLVSGTKINRFSQSRLSISIP